MRATHAALHFHQIYNSQAAPQAGIMLLPPGGWRLACQSMDSCSVSDLIRLFPDPTFKVIPDLDPDPDPFPDTGQRQTF